MKHVKIFCVYLVGLLTCFYSTQLVAQPAASASQIKEIQEVLDKMKDLKKNGKKDSDQEVKDLAKKAIELADKYYKIEMPPNTTEPEYDPDVKGEGVATPAGKKAKIKVGPKAFSSPGWLASTKLHEFVHASQLADGRWITPEMPPIPSTPDDIPGKNDDEKLKFLEELMKKIQALLDKIAKTSHINETEAYDKEIENAKKTGLSDAELKDIEERRKSHYEKLDKDNQTKIDQEKAKGEPYKTAMLPSTGKSMVTLTRRSELFVAGNVKAEERMLVTIRGTQSVEGNVVSVEIDGKKTETKTDSHGQAFLDISKIATGLIGSTNAIIKAIDKSGNEIISGTTTVNEGHPMIFERPQIGQLPDNIPKNEVITITGKNLGADARMVMGEQVQETLSASGSELTVFTDSKTGTQPVFIVGYNGVSKSQTVNIYQLDFTLPKSSITPKEVVAAQVNYESIPEGTKLVFTNHSAKTIRMDIPGASGSGNKIVYTISSTNGAIPVNITGINRGDFKIGLDTEFRNNNYAPR